MARNKLTENRIKSLTKPGMYGDGDGLYIRVQKAGSRNWIFVWRRGPERHEMGLGGYGSGTAPVSLAIAREKAEVIRQQLARGEDPKTRRRPLRVITFEHCMNELLASKATAWKNAKHKAQWEMTLREYAAPLHEMPIAEIVVGDVKDCLLPHWQERPETADRLRSRIQAVIDYGIAHEWRTAGNPARWKGLLDKVMPGRLKLSKGHHHALAYGSTPEMMAKLRKSKGVAARSVEFLTLTVARSSESRLARFSEFDLDAGMWLVPADRMKMGVEHRVPLTVRAIEIVKEMKARATGDYVFGGFRDNRPISDTAMTKALRRASPDKAATLHGMRSTFRDWAGDKTSHPREVAEAALSHVVGNEVERAYRRSDALEKRRRLMRDWADYCG